MYGLRKRSWRVCGRRVGRERLLGVVVGVIPDHDAKV